MKRFTIVCILLLNVCGCSYDVRVLTTDGNSEIVYCTGDVDWTTCISKACPNGFTVVSAPHPNIVGILKCKP